MLIFLKYSLRSDLIDAEGGMCMYVFGRCLRQSFQSRGSIMFECRLHIKTQIVWDDGGCGFLGLFSWFECLRLSLKFFWRGYSNSKFTKSWKSLTKQRFSLDLRRVPNWIPKHPIHISFLKQIIGHLQGPTKNACFDPFGAGCGHENGYCLASFVRLGRGSPAD
jgi:hypothetical protein